VPVTAVWTEAGRDHKQLRPLGSHGEETTLEQLEQALRGAREAPAAIVSRLKGWARTDAKDLRDELERRSKERLVTVTRELAARGETEAKSLADLLVAQRDRIAKAEAGYDPNQLALPGIAEAERKQYERDRRHWTTRLGEIEREISEESARVRDSYSVRADRLEAVGLVYLWPASG